MRFPHEDADFPALLARSASAMRLATGLVEKDYWVTHTLWALHAQGFEVWFKGGTSLSKGFHLIERFSEDLDLKIEPGTTRLASVSNWSGESRGAIAKRRGYFEELAATLEVPGATVELDLTPDEKALRGAIVRVKYRGRHIKDLGPAMRPFVQLEIGDARVTPAIERDLSSFVHEELARLGMTAEFANNRPVRVRCVHPLVTLLEKLDALQRRATREDCAPPTFVRHYGDAASIILGAGALPPLDGFADVRALADDLLSRKQINKLPREHDPAFALSPGDRTSEIRGASDAIGGMFWGERRSLDESCRIVRSWVGQWFG